MDPCLESLHLELRGAWPPVWRRTVGEGVEAWYSGGTSTRHNAVVAGLDVSTRRLATAANDAAPLYRAHGQTPRVEARPWDGEDQLRSFVELGACDKIEVFELPAQSWEAGTGRGRAVWERTPSADWLALVSTGLPPASVSAILSDVPHQQRFLRLEVDDEAGTVAALRLVRLGAGWGMFNLVVAPHIRGRGYGTTAVAMAIDCMGDEPCFLQVDHDNVPARRLYSRFGATLRYCFEVWDIGSDPL